jgi:hypothetical protein
VPTHLWIDPPEPPGEEALERLRSVCREHPRIVEAWVTGSRLADDGGPARDSTGIALVLDPPLEEEETRTADALVARLDAAAPTPGRRSWSFVSHELLESLGARAFRFYARTPASG